MGKTALITGASRGIGREIAIGLAERGMDVVVTCLGSTTLLLKLKTYIEEHCQVRCHAFTGDLGNPGVVDRLFEETAAFSPRLDVLVNNAGISHIGLFTDMSPEEWQRIVQTNLSSAIYCCKRAVPLMLTRKSGKIINISSVWGCVGASCEVAYSTVKGGMNAFTKALAKELAPSNIQVNAIACGAIDTEMNQFLSSNERAALIEEIPANRFGRPEEVAELVGSLCTGHEYLTGQVIKLDGGWI